mgnify:FL=1
MKRSKNFTVKLKRKLRQKTDYPKRLNLLASNKPRLVVRRMLNNILVQIVEYDANGDKVIVSANSRELVKLGWKGHRGNLPSAYLVGMIAGLKAKKKGIKETVSDIGLRGAIKGSSFFAAVKGAIDSGLVVPCSKEVMPSNDAIQGKLIESYAKLLLNEDKQKYDKQFSSYIKQGMKPEDFSKYFEEVKKKLLLKWQ